MRCFLALFAASCLSLFGQGTPTIFQTAPPDADAALRARINHFYQAHVDGKFRLAMEVVAEDSQETFFAADKPKYKSFRIVSINYEENFTKAKAVVEVPWELLTPLGVIDTVPRPMASFWKLENGKWCWYVIPYDPCKGIDAERFGKLHKQECVDGKPVAPPDGKAPNGLNMKEIEWMSVEDIHKMIRASDEKVMLSSHLPTSVDVRIDSRFPGEAELTLEAPELPGLTATLERGKIKTGESTLLRIAYKPPSPQRNPDQVVRVRIQPTAQVIEVTITFDLPPVEVFNKVQPAPAKPDKQK